jgi:hypothetical protein
LNFCPGSESKLREVTKYDPVKNSIISKFNNQMVYQREP